KVARGNEGGVRAANRVHLEVRARIGRQRACATTASKSAATAAPAFRCVSRGTAAGLGVSRDGEEKNESCNANRSLHSHMPFSAMNDDFDEYNGNWDTRGAGKLCLTK